MGFVFLLYTSVFLDMSLETLSDFEMSNILIFDFT